jgi:hypothetical protein
MKPYKSKLFVMIKSSRIYSKDKHMVRVQNEVIQFISFKNHALYLPLSMLSAFLWSHYYKKMSMGLDELRTSLPLKLYCFLPCSWFLVTMAVKCNHCCQTIWLLTERTDDSLVNEHDQTKDLIFCIPMQNMANEFWCSFTQLISSTSLLTLLLLALLLGGDKVTGEIWEFHLSQKIFGGVSESLFVICELEDLALFKTGALLPHQLSWQMVVPSSLTRLFDVHSLVTVNYFHTIASSNSKYSCYRIRYHTLQWCWYKEIPISYHCCPGRQRGHERLS